MSYKKYYRATLLFLSILVFLASNLVGAVFAQDNDPTAQDYYLQGVDLNNNREFEEAVSALSQAIELNPEYADAYVERSKAYVELNQLDLALTDIDEAIELEPENVIAFNTRGLVYRGMDDTEQAIEAFTHAIDLDPEYLDAYLERGFSYDLKVEASANSAISDFTYVIDTNPDNFRAYIGRGLAYGNQGQYELAINDFSTAIEVDPTSSEAYNYRGDGYRKMLDFDKAIEDFTRAIELNPYLADAYLNRGSAYFTEGQQSGDEKFFDLVIVDLCEYENLVANNIPPQIQIVTNQMKTEIGRDCEISEISSDDIVYQFENTSIEFHYPDWLTMQPDDNGNIMLADYVTTAMFIFNPMVIREEDLNSSTEGIDFIIDALPTLGVTEYTEPIEIELADGRLAYRLDFDFRDSGEGIAMVVNFSNGEIGIIIAINPVSDFSEIEDHILMIVETFDSQEDSED